MGDTNKNKGTYTFSKPKIIKNSEKWAQKIWFALQNAGLINYTFGTSAKPKLYIEEQKFFKDKFTLWSEEKIEKREAKFNIWILNNTCTRKKIRKIYTKAVQ